MHRFKKSRSITFTPVRPVHQKYTRFEKLSDGIAIWGHLWLTQSQLIDYGECGINEEKIKFMIIFDWVRASAVFDV